MADAGYVFDGTHIQVRWYIDRTNNHNPVFVFEEHEESRIPLAINREAIAGEISKALHSSPERLTWIEQGPDGSLVEYVFRSGYTIKSAKVPREQIEQLLGERLEPFAMRRAQEFNDATAPAREIPQGIILSDIQLLS